MVELTINLTDEDAQRLRERARMMEMEPEELAGSLLTEALSTLPEDFKTLVDEELEENAELYRRLS